MVVVPHSEVIEFICGCSHGIGFAEGGLEGLLEGVPVGGEFGKVVIFKFEGRLIPLLGGTLEPRGSVGDLDGVFAEIVSAAPED